VTPAPADQARVGFLQSNSRGIVIERTERGAYVVTIRPIHSRPDLERGFHFPDRARDYAAQLADRFGWQIVDLSTVSE